MKRFGGLVAVELADAAAVQRLVERGALLIASTSFGGIHTSVDRRARWGDQVRTASPASRWGSRTPTT